MSKKMFIDASHPEETRVVVVDGSRVDEFDFESQSRRQLRGNIYLARVTRVEPSLQAAFVEYGGNRHGFLAFSEIHPDYYQIPVDDRKKLLEEERKAAEAEAARDNADSPPAEEPEGEAAQARPRAHHRAYKIQEVIKRRQILLVQVVKEERGNKGAALTTYLSLAGRYCVLMPNTARGGGISRKITSATDRKRLKKVAADLEVPDGMGLIVRTAGAKRTKTEIKRDSDYLLRLWETIREQTLKSVAPCLIYEESNLVKRAIRDLYDKDIDSVLVEGDDAYREAKDFIRMLMPSHAKKVQPYKDETPLFLKHKVEDQLEQIYQPVVQLKSGGYLVINQTEALVAIDVNSGRSTRERNIEATALKTNLEAAEEACRQFRLRDLAGLIVLDFIDMDEAKNNRAVEKKMRDCLSRDRARVQTSKISSFGLMELSRQRRRASLLEGSHSECPTCKGRGLVRSVESAALHALRRIEEEGLKARAKTIRVRTDPRVAFYLLNEKRDSLNAVEARCGMRALIDGDETLIPPEIEISAVEERREDAVAKAPPLSAESADIDEAAPAAEEEKEEAREEGGRKRRRRRSRRKPAGAETADARTAADQGEEADAEEAEADADEVKAEGAAGEKEETGESKPRRRRRGRRGGRGRRTGAAATAEGEAPEGLRVINPGTEGEDETAEAVESETESSAEADKGKPSSRGRRRKADDGAQQVEEPLVGFDEDGEIDTTPQPEPARSRAPEPEPATDSTPEPAAGMPSEAEPEPETEPAEAAEPEPALASTAATPASPAELDPEAEEARKRWQSRVKSWLGG